MTPSSNAATAASSTNDDPSPPPPPPLPSSSSSSSSSSFRVAIVGGGIAGSCAASVLCSSSAPSSRRSQLSSSSSSAAANGNDEEESGEQHAPPLPSTAARRRRGRRIDVTVDLFDQGRSGLGGRSSTRPRRRRRRERTSGEGTTEEEEEGVSMRWDHGCQFFRADTPRFRSVVSDWIDRGLASEWRGTFASSSDCSPPEEFFGLPSRPPFYVGGGSSSSKNDSGGGGMDSIPNGILKPYESCRRASSSKDNVGEDGEEEDDALLRVFRGTRVSRMERSSRGGGGVNGDPVNTKWHLFGTSGEVAYHDTPESIAKGAEEVPLGRIRSRRAHSGGDEEDEGNGYDAVILTDVSSSFGSWHRASAGVPEQFAQRVRERVGARVPLFTAMVAFESRLPVEFDAVSFGKDSDDNGGDGKLWFAARMDSKPGVVPAAAAEDLVGTNDENDGEQELDCWTLVSTPEYAVDLIAETPMQDADTGEFIPQSKEYLRAVPGSGLLDAFRRALCTEGSIVANQTTVKDRSDIPAVVHLDAQRWGSAMPANRSSSSGRARRILSGVTYDAERTALAPTVRLADDDDDDSNDENGERNCLVDEELMLFQAGDMVSSYTPGFEGAALSGMDAAECVLDLLLSGKATSRGGTV